SSFGMLNCVDLCRVGRRLQALLEPGAPVLFSLMGRWPLPATVERALTGRGPRRRDGAVAVAGVDIDVRYPSFKAMRRELGLVFEWRRAAALGVVVPGPGHHRFASEGPQTFGVLAMVERVVRDLPGLRA